MTWGKDNASRAREPFEEQWPELARGLASALRARRVPASRREDIIQETGLRLFVHWGQLDPDRAVWPFALTVALNLVRDEQRMQARRGAVSPRVDDPSERGVEEEALARLELTSVQDALQKLTLAQRSVLLADLGEMPYDDKAPAALKMLRMRARRTLRNVIDRASALVPLAHVHFRRTVNSIGVSLHRSGTEHAQIVVLSTLGVAGAASIIGAVVGVETHAGGAERSAPALVLQTAATVDARAAGHGTDAAARFRRDDFGYSAREVRGGRGVVHRHSSAGGGSPAEATLGAGGTGIDDDASLRSRRFRVWASARAVASGREAEVDYEVEQANPVCGSPVGTTQSSRSCIRAEGPRARARARVEGRPAGGGQLVSPRYRRAPGT